MSTAGGPPPRPAAWEERTASSLFRWLAPYLERVPGLPPPPELAPWQHVEVPRHEGGGVLPGTWYEATPPAGGRVRGGVLLLPPWVRVGQAWFHRGTRLPSLRAAGYHVLTLDFAGLPGGPPPAGFADRDAAAGLDYLHRRLDGLPLHVWGVSSGGYWVHPALSRRHCAAGAVFEDVSPHLVEWSWRSAPRGRPGYLVLHYVLTRAYRFLDLRRHAAHLGVAAAAYVGSADDAAIRASETEHLARLAGARCLIVPDAQHLAAFRRAGAEITALALDTFARAEAARDPAAG